MQAIAIVKETAMLFKEFAFSNVLFFDFFVKHRQVDSGIEM